MMRHPDSLPWLGRQLVAVLLALATAAHAVSPPGPIQRDRTAELGPEVVARRAELNRKIREAKGNYWNGMMTAEIARIGDALTLTAAQRKELEAPAKEAVGLAIEEWIRWGQSNWERYVPDTKEEALAMLEQAIGMVDVSARHEYGGPYTPPHEQAQWHEALKRVLTAEQWKRWDDLRKEREAEIDKIFEGELRDAIEQLRVKSTEMIQKRVEVMRAPLQLAPGRISELDRAAEKLAGELVASQCHYVRVALRSMEPETLRNMVRGAKATRGLAVGEMLSGDTPELQTAQLFTEEERRQLREKTEVTRSRRTHALGRVFLTVIDDEVALTAAQREKLIPHAEAAVQTRTELYPGVDRQGYYQINLSKLLAAGNAVPEAELTKLLDATQLRRWKDASSGNSLSTRRRNPFLRIVDQPPVVPATDTDAEPEAVEMAISDTLYERAQNERRRLLGVNLLKAEDATRVAGISKELGLQLATAARGATEVDLARWRADFEQQVRGQLRDVSAANIRQRLAALDRNVYARATQTGQAKESLLDVALGRTLTEPQRQSWQREVEARGAFRNEAVASLILTDFAAEVAISEPARQKLEPMIREAVKTYGRDIASMFSYYDTDWFLQSNSLFVPFAALPEAEVKALVGDSAWEAWSKGPQFANAMNYWENIQRIHANRVRTEKVREIPGRKIDNVPEIRVRKINP